ETRPHLRTHRAPARDRHPRRRADGARPGSHAAAAPRRRHRKRPARPVPESGPGGCPWPVPGAPGARIGRVVTAPIASLAQGLASRRLSSVELTTALLDRVAALGSRLNAFLAVDRER